MNFQYKRTVYYVSIITMIINMILCLFKLVAGLYGHSQAMLSDAIHSLSDVLSTLIVMIGVHFSTQKADHEHPYGHDRIECIAAMLLAVLLVFTGLQSGYQSLCYLIYPHTIVIPSMIALIAAIISIVIKEAMYWYTLYYATKIRSSSLTADALHHRSDAFSSIASLIGIGGSMLGLSWLDPIASLCLCIFILKPAICIFYDATMKMIDHSCKDEIIQQLTSFILKQDCVLSIDLLKTRMFNEKYYIDLEIGVDEKLSLNEAHLIAHQVHDNLEKEFPDIKHCMIHVNPKSNHHIV